MFPNALLDAAVIASRRRGDPFYHCERSEGIQEINLDHHVASLLVMTGRLLAMTSDNQAAIFCALAITSSMEPTI